jgi:hypothetical protein
MEAVMLISPQGAEFLTRISAKFIYGTIILAAVIGSLADPLPHSLRVIVVVLVSLYGVNLANNYALSINEDMTNRRVTPMADQWRSLLRPNWLMGSVIIPVVLFGAAAAGILSQEAALTATRYALALTVFAMGFIARRICGGDVWRSLLSGFTVALLGYAVTQLKLWSKYLPGLPALIG